MLLAGLLIIAMMIIQVPSEGETGLIYWLGLIIICCSVIFILYETVSISNKLNATTNELNELKEKVRQLKPAKTEEKKEQNSQEEK